MADQTTYTQKLKGSKILVIGGSSGIGFGVASALIEHGAHVAISSSNDAKIEKSINAIKAAYPSATARIHGSVCNLGDSSTLESNISALFEAVTKSLGGKLDHVVYTAGDALAMMPIDSADMAKVTKAGNVRFFGPIMVGKIAPAHMNPGPKSSITLTTGSVSEKPMPGWSVIGSFATGLQGMCRGLALDLKPLRVNLISPGAVKTELWESSGLTEDMQSDLFEKTAAKLPTGQIGSVVDVVEPYLCAIKDNNMTGTMISSNGGGLLV